ncbi:MAG: hypothetical protein PHY12_06765 [Eubacteriales bacterium]|nr:hypothetical protein [Eubacteriales bacterium]
MQPENWRDEQEPASPRARRRASAQPRPGAPYGGDAARTDANGVPDYLLEKPSGRYQQRYWGGQTPEPAAQPPAPTPDFSSAPDFPDARSLPDFSAPPDFSAAPGVPYAADAWRDASARFQPSAGGGRPYDPAALNEEPLLPADATGDFAPPAWMDTTAHREPVYAPEWMPQPAPRPAEPPRAKPQAAPEKPKPRAKQQPPKPAARTVRPGRFALLVLCGLALLFCGIEGGKMVASMWQNEREMKAVRSDYLARAGVPLERDATRVELLPQGQTYVPTATPVPALATATPAPRIAQNDPLIGVLDGGGATFEAALPTPTPVSSRTRLSRYPDNPLLNVSDAFTALLAQNGDVIGRLTIDGVLDETVVQRNNTYYLTHNARGTFGSFGAIFMDEACTLRKPPENIILRGQCTDAGKLFEPLTQYADADFAAQHALVRMDTIYEQAQYRVFAVVHANTRTDSSDYFNFAGYATFPSDDQMMRYVESAKARSVAALEADVQPGDRLLTLSTLETGDDGYCWVVLARMLRAGEAR